MAWRGVAWWCIMMMWWWCGGVVVEAKVPLVEVASWHGMAWQLMVGDSSKNDNNVVVVIVVTF